MNIRQCTLADLACITEFTLKLHHHEKNDQLLLHSNFKTNLKHWLESELNNTNSLLLIAEVDGEAIGFIAATSVINDNGFLKEPLKGVVQLLWVEEEYRKKKTAESLLNNVEACFVENGIKYVECSFTNNNNLAKAFWQTHGYSAISTMSRKIL